MPKWYGVNGRPQGVEELRNYLVERDIEAIMDDPWDFITEQVRHNYERMQEEELQEEYEEFHDSEPEGVSEDDKTTGGKPIS